MNIQKHAVFNNAHYYALEPHDGTHYEFMMIKLNERDGNTQLTETDLVRTTTAAGAVPHYVVQTNRDMSGKPPIIGVGDGEGYTLLVIIMTGGQAAVPILDLHLREINKAFEVNSLEGMADAVSSPYGYYLSHAGGNIYITTLTAILLAASVLLYEPDNMHRAAEAGRLGQYVAALL